MGKLVLDLHPIYNKGREIDNALEEFFNEAIDSRIPILEIIPGKGSGQLKKKVVRFLQHRERKTHIAKVEVNHSNHGKIIVRMKR